MIECDYFILGGGIAGIGLAHKLNGDIVLVDKKPFSYKIGESQVPNVIHGDDDLIKLIPKIKKMKSFSIKKGSVFYDFHSKECAIGITDSLEQRLSLGGVFTFHCERAEFERLLAKEFSLCIQEEKVIDIDLEKNIVITDKEVYKFRKKFLDCSGGSMWLARKLGYAKELSCLHDYKQYGDIGR